MEILGLPDRWDDRPINKYLASCDQEAANKALTYYQGMFKSTRKLRLQQTEA